MPNLYRPTEEGSMFFFAYHRFNYRIKPQRSVCQATQKAQCKRKKKSKMLNAKGIQQLHELNHKRGYKGSKEIRGRKIIRFFKLLPKIFISFFFVANTSHISD